MKRQIHTPQIGALLHSSMPLHMQLHIEELKRRGLYRSLASDQGCLILMAPYRKLPTARLIDESRICSSILGHAVLAHKAYLQQLLVGGPHAIAQLCTFAGGSACGMMFSELRSESTQGYAAIPLGTAIKEPIVISGSRSKSSLASSGLQSAARDASHLLMECAAGVAEARERETNWKRSCTWILKHCRQNNALAVSLLPSAVSPEFDDLVREIIAPITGTRSIGSGTTVDDEAALLAGSGHAHGAEGGSDWSTTRALQLEGDNGSKAIERATETTSAGAMVTGAPMAEASASGDEWILEPYLSMPLLMATRPPMTSRGYKQSSTIDGIRTSSELAAPQKLQPQHEAGHVGGCKFTLRLNVLITGHMAVLVHGEPILHCATMPYDQLLREECTVTEKGVLDRYLSPTPALDLRVDRQAHEGRPQMSTAVPRPAFARQAHITNHSERHMDAGSSKEQHTLTLGEAIHEAKAGNLQLMNTKGDDVRSDGLLFAARDVVVPQPPSAAGHEPAQVGSVDIGATDDRIIPGEHVVDPEVLGSPLFLEACRAAQAVVVAARCSTGKHRLLPCPSGFEIFGLDFLVQGDRRPSEQAASSEATYYLPKPWRLALLECNQGPALGALARPDMCRRVIQDLWTVCVDPVLRVGASISHIYQGGDTPNKDATSRLLSDEMPALYGPLLVGHPWPLPIRGTAFCLVAREMGAPPSKICAVIAETIARRGTESDSDSD